MISSVYDPERVEDRNRIIAGEVCSRTAASPESGDRGTSRAWAARARSAIPTTPVDSAQIVRDEEGWCLIVQDGPGHWSRVDGPFSSRREARMRVQQGIDLRAALGDFDGLPTRGRPQHCDPAGSGGAVPSDLQRLIGSVQFLKGKLADMMSVLSGHLHSTACELWQARCPHRLMLTFDHRDVIQEAYEINRLCGPLEELVLMLDAIDPDMAL